MIWKKIWDYTFKNELNINPMDYNIVITQPLKNPKVNKEKTLNIMFEYFCFKGLNMPYSTTLSLYSAGKFNGISIDLGDGSTQFCPIFDGYEILDNAERINIGGKDITKYIKKLLSKRQYDFAYDKKIANDIKEKSCFIAYDYEEEYKSVKPFDYELPDGKQAIVDAKRMKYPEAFLFNPLIKFWERKGIPGICFDIINKCGMSMISDLYSSIILSGGNSMFKGFPERFKKEITNLAPEKMKEVIKVIASPERKYFSWIGASVFSNLTTFEKVLITKSDYEEYGASSIIANKIN